MRSKMLGLAIALSTFGLGVAATTLWINHHAPTVQRTEATRAGLVGGSYITEVSAAEDSRCGGNVPYLLDDESEPNPASVLPLDPLRGREMSKPAPRYPAEAVRAQISGTVLVRVTVNACGEVVKARAISGNSLLRRAAVDAAMKARFKPKFLDGTFTDVAGTLRYDFLLQ